MSYGQDVRRCKRCKRVFCSDCADYCFNCSEVVKNEKAKERYEVLRVEAKVRISGFRLKIELVPQPLWYRNLRNMLKEPGDWDIIRHRAYADSGHRCAVCGDFGRLNCHEIWAYDDVHHVQKLMGFTALCDLCTRVKHIGQAEIMVSRGELDMNSVIRHFRRVNDCSYQDFLEAQRLAFEVWEERSFCEWSQDWGEYAGGVK